MISVTQALSETLLFQEFEKPVQVFGELLLQVKHLPKPSTWKLTAGSPRQSEPSSGREYKVEKKTTIEFKWWVGTVAA